MSLGTHVLLTAISRGELFLSFLESAVSLVSVCPLHEEVLDAIVFNHDKLEAICLVCIIRLGRPHPLLYSFRCCSSRIHDVKLRPHVADNVL